SYATEELEPGIFERIIIVRTNNPEFFEVEVPFELTVISGFGSLTGTVIDAAYDSPVEGAVISIPRFGFEAITDEEGTYLFEEVPEWIYIVEIHAVNYHPQTVEDIEVVEDETTELNFSLLHSECNPSTRNIFRALEPDFRQTVEFDIDNDGNAPLTWRVERTLPENVDRELWELRVESNTEELVGDDMINGVTFAEGHFYISGGNNGGNPNMIYVFDSEGEQVGEFEQAHESRYGMRDLTYDGELIWGSDENVLYGYSLEGEHVETLQGEAQSYRSVTWDPVNERFWSADITSNIFATNRQGNLVQTINRPGDIRIYGLGFWPDDPDGHCLYVFSRGDEIDVAVYKINLDNGESILAAEFDVGGSRPGGIHITNLLDVYSWVLMGIVQTPDRMMVWQLSTNRAWFRISPEDGEIAAGESQHFELILDATDIPTETTMEGFLVFTHDGNGYETIISVTLRVEEGEVQTFRELDLHVGWNTVSVNLQPDDHENIRGLMSALVEENLLIMMKNGAGEFYIPEYDFSNIRGWFAPQGYQLKMRGEAIFRLDGMSVLRDAEISLSEGWQLISYYPRFPIEATVALSGIEEHLIIAKDGYGNFYIPDWDFSNMGDMREGQGYYINVDSGIVLVYRTERPDDEGAFAGVRHSSVYDEPGQLPVHAVTGVNMSLLVLSDSPLLLQGGSKGGCEIGVYANNQLIGSGVLQNGVCGIAVWGDDPSTDETDGALEGLSFEIRLLTGEGGLSTPEYTVLAGEAVYTTDGFAVVQLTASSVMPVEFGINSAYPNPFNSVMRISYGLVEAGDVSLNVYDLTGRHVVELVNGYFKTGMHVAVLDGIDLSSGLYMLRLESGSDVSQMKVVLVK
ncbi:carboxypeptidase regulatory-like domain-containing protein, partial [bacterium]|nr:carboxypeptidase regulatory-like domain-containing protein [bacterium]